MSEITSYKRWKLQTSQKKEKKDARLDRAGPLLSIKPKHLRKYIIKIKNKKYVASCKKRNV
jgi:hypothetical protein